MTKSKVTKLGKTACNICGVITITRVLFNNHYPENHYHENDYRENHYHENHYHDIHHFVAVIDDITRCKDTDLGGFPVWSILLGFESFSVIITIVILSTIVIVIISIMIIGRIPVWSILLGFESFSYQSSLSL